MALPEDRKNVEILTEPINLEHITATSTLTPQLALPSNVRFINNKPPDIRVAIKIERKIALEDIYFDPGKAEIKPKFKPILDEVVRILRENPSLKLSIEGHTGSLGTDEYNQMLSEQRAQSVLRYLVRKGIDSNRLKAIGFGKSQPIADNQTKEGRRLNRRVELKFVE